MSQENVDQFVASVEAFNRMDIPGLLRLLDPEIHFEHRVAALEGTYSGLDGVRASSWISPSTSRLSMLIVRTSGTSATACLGWALPAPRGSGAEPRPS